MRVNPAVSGIQFGGDTEVAKILRTKSNEEILAELPRLAQESRDTRVRRGLKNFFTLQWFFNFNPYDEKRFDLEQALLKRSIAGKIDDEKLIALADSGYEIRSGYLKSRILDLSV